MLPEPAEQARSGNQQQAVAASVETGGLQVLANLPGETDDFLLHGIHRDAHRVPALTHGVEAAARAVGVQIAGMYWPWALVLASISDFL